MWLLAMMLGTPCLGQMRIVSYNCAQLVGNQAAFQAVLAELHADNRPGHAVPVAIFVFQEVKSANVTPLLNLINASAPQGITYALGTYTNDGEDGFGGAQAMFYRTDMIQEIASAHVDIYSGAGRFADRWRIKLVNYLPIQSYFYVYSSHLKSDEGAANEQERLLGVQNIRANADALGANQNIIYAGDQNFYDNGEPGYLHYFSAGNGIANDPLGTGSWAGGANALKHSQSPRAVAGGGLVGGGLDDRFDFQLISNALNDGMGLSIMTGTNYVYRGLGNDGQHYDMAINAGNNTYYWWDIPRSNALATNLHNGSDHVPIVVDFQIPAVMSGSIPADYGRVIQHAPFSVAITVMNTANVVTPLGADILTFNAVASLGLSGSFSDTVEPMGDVSSPSFPLNTSLVGQRTGRVTLTSSSQAVQNSNVVLNTTGLIVRPANGSFASSSDVNQASVKDSLEPDSGVHHYQVDIFNFGFDSLQARLDVDEVIDLAAPFSFMGGLADGIGATPATLDFAFDSTGLSDGVYNAAALVHISDEDIPGESPSMLSINFAVTVGGAKACDADITGEGVVNVDDLLAVINAWGACPGGKSPPPCPADTNGDAFVNVDDLLAVINGWGVCP